MSFDIADVIYIAGRGKPTGLLTVKYSDHTANVGLLAVDEDCRGQGVASQLLASLEHSCLEKGIDIILIPTQRNNKNACEFYAKAGFNKTSASVRYHCWFTKQG